ncbi:hypothetical protein [Fodinibius salsisoli]|uniref:Uncharacterized protein n=1 Tax=Fodinibius salsisoli TaxID=2820877 RepID=A0ABT3PQE6_9BACT|nr:hypothetical protein [Fodinibius salsisoli]MCW9708085.1 hypothetical protein [Fodinibius salsisoli]
MSKEEGFFKVKIESSTEKDYKALQAKKEKLKEEASALQEQYNSEIAKALKIDDPQRRIDKLQAGLSLLKRHRINGKVDQNWADRKIKLLGREIDKAEDAIYRSGKGSTDKSGDGKRGRKPISAEVKQKIKQYYRTNKEQLENNNEDADGYPIQAWIARQILEEKDEDIGISDAYADPERTIIECMNDI